MLLLEHLILDSVASTVKELPSESNSTMGLPKETEQIVLCMFALLTLSVGSGKVLAEVSLMSDSMHTLSPGTSVVVQVLPPTVSVFSVLFTNSTFNTLATFSILAVEPKALVTIVFCFTVPSEGDTPIVVYLGA